MTTPAEAEPAIPGRDRARRQRQALTGVAILAATALVATGLLALSLAGRPTQPVAAVTPAAAAGADRQLVDQLAQAKAKLATCRALGKVLLSAARSLDRNFKVHHSAHARMMGHDLAGRPVPEISREERNRIWRVTLGARSRTSPVFQAADAEHAKAGCQ